MQISENIWEIPFTFRIQPPLRLPRDQLPQQEPQQHENQRQPLHQQQPQRPRHQSQQRQENLQQPLPPEQESQQLKQQRRKSQQRQRNRELPRGKHRKLSLPRDRRHQVQHHQKRTTSGSIIKKCGDTLCTSEMEHMSLRGQIQGKSLQNILYNCMCVAFLYVHSRSMAQYQLTHG